ncbi:hypothetical protein CBE01nite_36300 [Clostridium beijerinckii]|nr:hypothetical protein CBE01nite_36300 [Clostridium beijerinckii]
MPYKYYFLFIIKTDLIQYILIYIAKMILHYNSKNIAIILVAIVNCEMCIVNCNIYIIRYNDQHQDS